VSLHVCLECTTLYAIGLKACPHCGTPTRDAVYRWEDDVVKTNSAGVATLYLAEGQPAPADLPAGVVLVGPGSGEVTDAAVQPPLRPSAEAVTEPPKRKPGRPRKVQP
jgi:RNA polymerase subunit RPABC4/transcription elongation factor Spt4